MTLPVKGDASVPSPASSTIQKPVHLGSIPAMLKSWRPSTQTRPSIAPDARRSQLPARGRVVASALTGGEAAGGVVVLPPRPAALLRVNAPAVAGPGR